MILVYPVARKIVWLFVKLFVKEMKGMENIPRKGPFIVAANHESYLDPLLLAYYIMRKTNQKIHFIAYGGRFSFLGKFIIKKWAGCILIRYNKQEIKEALEEAISILKKGGIVGIFPAAPDNDLARPRTGVARIALGANCQVLPVVIKGTGRIMPSPSLIPKHVRCAYLEFRKPLEFEKEKNFHYVTQEIARFLR